MCGIAGIFAYGHGAPGISRQVLANVRDSMAARGPDGSGLWSDTESRIGLAHRRLSIIDVSEAGAQPMASVDGRYVVTYNGEIYNYPELRRLLEAKGTQFRSNSDTEVLLHLYALRGPQMVRELRGMFALAIWDRDERTLFLARDPFGIKPLYYADDGGTLRFASQVKAVHRFGPEVDTAVDPAGHVGYFVFGSVPEPFTLFRGIRQLEAGTFMVVATGRAPRATVYFDLTREVVVAESECVEMPRAEAQERVAGFIEDSVRHHLLSDVDVGIFLSSGVDSAVLAAAATSVSSAKVGTLTLGFNEYRGTENDETPGARIVAAALGTRHVESWISSVAFKSDGREILEAMDQPSNDGINTYFVSREASRQPLKVALSGVGADELFCGYPSFRQVPRLASLPSLMRLPGRAMRRVLALLGPRAINPKYASLFEYAGSVSGAYLLRRSLFLPWELESLLDRDLLHAGMNELDPLARLDATVGAIMRPDLKVFALERAWYTRNQLLRDADWAGMAHSLEIRVPYVDVELFRATLRISVNGRIPDKSVLSSSWAKLPRDLATRPKTGFTIPVRAWSEEAQQERGLRGWSRLTYEQSPPGFSTKRPTLQRTILVFRAGQLGDTLVAMPAMAWLRRKYSQHRFALLYDAHPGQSFVTAAEVLLPTGWFENAVRYVARRGPLLMAYYALNLAYKLRRQNVKGVYDLSLQRGASRYFRNEWFFRRLCGADSYVNGAELEATTGRGSDRRARLEPEWAFWLRVVGADPDGLGFRLRIPEEAQQEANALLGTQCDGADVTLIAVAPGSKMQAKVWPIERYIAVGKAILEGNSKAMIVVLGAGGERSLGELMNEALGARVLNLAGSLSIYGSAAVLARCSAYFGNDSGPMHLSGMVGTPCVGIFSARDHPGLWEPYGKDHIVLRKEVDCAGCMLETCEKEGRRCLSAISTDEVLSAVRSVLAVESRRESEGAALQ